MIPPRYLKCLDDCGYKPGLEVSFPDSAINWFTESTPDQSRIEDWLVHHLDKYSIHPGGDVLLHVGIGDSRFAQRFCPIVQQVYGLTLGERELAHANRLGLSNYHAHRVNKYHPQLLSRFPWRPFSFIVDNNLASYACCRKHFHGMLVSYMLMLRDGGAILTDRAGLAHAPGDPNWNIEQDIEAIASKVGLTAAWETDWVLSLREERDENE